MKKVTILVIFIALTTGLFTGCNKDEENPPSIPSVESMKIDFSNFDNEKKHAFYSNSKGIENSNWEFSAFVAGFWNEIIVTTLAIPLITFSLAVNETPVYLENKTWEWNYDATIFTAVYKARLTGQIRTRDIEWKLYISREGSGGFSEFLWVQGTSNLDGTSGQWIFNHSSSYKEPILQIDWTGNGIEILTVKYTYVRVLNDSRVNDLFRTSYIEYGKQTGNYNAYYSIHYFNGADFSDVQVEWSTTGKHGRIKCEKFFSDNEWHCWNGNYINVICPE